MLRFELESRYIHLRFSVFYGKVEVMKFVQEQSGDDLNAQVITAFTNAQPYINTLEELRDLPYLEDGELNDAMRGQPEKATDLRKRRDAADATLELDISLNGIFGRFVKVSVLAPGSVTEVIPTSEGDSCETVFTSSELRGTIVGRGVRGNSLQIVPQIGTALNRDRGYYRVSVLNETQDGVVSPAIQLVERKPSVRDRGVYAPQWGLLERLGLAKF